eukprot:15482869-Alexandrium_andersonii.AAC.1
MPQLSDAAVIVVCFGDAPADPKDVLLGTGSASAVVDVFSSGSAVGAHRPCWQKLCVVAAAQARSLCESWPCRFSLPVRARRPRPRQVSPTKRRQGYQARVLTLRTLALRVRLRALRPLPSRLSQASFGDALFA